MRPVAQSALPPIPWRGEPRISTFSARRSLARRGGVARAVRCGSRGAEGGIRDRARSCRGVGDLSLRAPGAGRGRVDRACQRAHGAADGASAAPDHDRRTALSGRASDPAARYLEVGDRELLSDPAERVSRRPGERPELTALHVCRRREQRPDRVSVVDIAWRQGGGHCRCRDRQLEAANGPGLDRGGSSSGPQRPRRTSRRRSLLRPSGSRCR
jgi:hypothetical protein